MSDYVGYDDDEVGEDFVGASDEEILGAVRRARRGGALQVQRAMKPQLKAAERPPTKLRGYLGLGTVSFTSASGTSLSITVEPQRGFRPERLIVDRADGSTATADIQARVAGIYIGDQPQSPSIEQPAPIALFRADATVSGIDFDKCLPGQKITIQYSVTAAPTGTEVVNLSAGFYGDMLR